MAMTINPTTPTSKQTVSFHTLGCRLNFSESGSIADGFAKRNYQIIDWGQQADITFINTCTVTDSADSSCRNIIRQSQKFSPGGKIVVAGCMAQMAPEEISKMGGVDLILGNHEKYKVFEYLENDQENMIKIDKHNEFWGASSGINDGKTRSFLKIQDGCNYICSFCIIPFARGRSRCIDPKLALEQLDALILEGKKEVVLTGVNIGEYKGPQGETLYDLLTLLLDKAQSNNMRFRLSSVEPNTINEDLVRLLSKYSCFQDHFHVPMQSGSDTVLKLMKRKYDVEYYRKTINLIRNFFPNAGIGGDIIVGHPGESLEDFHLTKSLIQELELTHLHVFPYSRRKNTVSDKMLEHIPHQEKKRRAKELRELGEKNYQAWINKPQTQSLSYNVLFESYDSKNNCWNGFSSNYIKVHYQSSEDLHNKIIPLNLQSDNVSFYI